MNVWTAGQFAPHEAYVLTKDDARNKMNELLAERGRYITGGLALVDEMTLEKPYGWVFFYNSRRFLETRDMLHGIAGNGPVVVVASTGEVVTLGSSRAPAEEVAEFERQRGLSSKIE